MSSYGDHRKSLTRELKLRIIKAGGKGVSVIGGRGTAWGWIEVWSPKDGFTDAQRGAIERVTGNLAGGNCWVGEIKEVERIVGITYLIRAEGGN